MSSTATDGLNKANDMASNMVDLPVPFVPTISVDLALLRSIVIALLPVERKFLYVSSLNNIMGILYH